MVLGFSAFSGFSNLMYPIIQFSWDAQSPVGVREVDVVFSFFVVGTRKIYFVMNLIVQNPTNLAVTPTGVCSDLLSLLGSLDPLQSDYLY